MSAHRYVRYAQEAFLNYFRDFKTIEVRVSYLGENLPQSPPNSPGREPAEHGGPHFGSNEEVIPTATPNPLIQADVGKRVKHIPSSLIGLAFQAERP